MVTIRVKVMREFSKQVAFLTMVSIRVKLMVTIGVKVTVLKGEFSKERT